MIACKCKRCGKLYEPYVGIKSGEYREANGIILVNTALSGEVTETSVLDLCPECMTEFSEFFGGAKNG